MQEIGMNKFFIDLKNKNKKKPLPRLDKLSWEDWYALKIFEKRCVYYFLKEISNKYNNRSEIIYRNEFLG